MQASDSSMRCWAELFPQVYALQTPNPAGLRVEHTTLGRAVPRGARAVKHFCSSSPRAQETHSWTAWCTRQGHASIQASASSMRCWAGLFPEVHTLEAVAGQILTDDISAILERVAGEARLEGRFFMCKQDSLLEVAALLHNVKDLSLEVCPPPATPLQPPCSPHPPGMTLLCWAAVHAWPRPIAPARALHGPAVLGCCACMPSCQQRQHVQHSSRTLRPLPCMSVHTHSFACRRCDEADCAQQTMPGSTSASSVF